MAVETLATDAVAHGTDLVRVVALLGAAVIAVPIFKRLGLGTVLGYFAAGLAIGPFGFALFVDPEAILHIAELGVVMLLFIIGLEMRPSRLWSLRKDIFGLGAAQVAMCGMLLTGVGLAAGLPPAAAFVAGLGFTMTSTAMVVQLLGERGQLTARPGQRIVAILLFEDLAIVPLLAIVALLAPGVQGDGPTLWIRLLTAVGSIAAIFFAGRYVLTPLFRIIAATKAREAMTATALLIVLGAALLLDVGGLSMALGAFLAGVVLSESSFRHQLEADVEPFRGLLLGLFFLSVGMSLDIGVVARSWPLVLAGLVAFMLVKAGGIYTLARLARTGHGEALRRAALMAQGGEFAFVLYSTAATAGVIANGQTAAVLTAIVVLSMALTPLIVTLSERLTPMAPASLDGVAPPNGETGAALIIGFGRFGQVVSQALLARGIDVTIIDSDPERIRNAATFGFKIYYGDGTRLDVLHAAGAGSARVICVCTDRPDVTSHIVELLQSEFPLAKLHVRSFDRGHSLALRARGVTFEVRETIYSALALGEASLRGLGFTAEEAADTAAEVRRRDLERLRLQEMEGNLAAGRDLVFRPPVPTPLVPVRRGGRPLSQETAMVASAAAEPAAAKAPEPEPLSAEPR